MYFDVTIHTRDGLRVAESHVFVAADSPDQAAALACQGHAPGTVRVVGVTAAKTTEGGDQTGPVRQQAVVAPLVRSDDEMICAALQFLPADYAQAIRRRFTELEEAATAPKRPVLTIDKRKRA